jgi:ATP-dependent DNA ligase
LKLYSIFSSNSEVFEEYRHPDIATPNGNNLELDFFFPQLKLAIEYQVTHPSKSYSPSEGSQHYRSTTYMHNFASHEERSSFDSLKVSLCKQKGITLIAIPYWWDKQFPSLTATIYSHRPDLFANPTASAPIPSVEPSRKKRESAQSSKILMTSTVLGSEDPTGWWMTEKYDGVRLYWNRSGFYTRQGKKVIVPEKMTREMPDVELDGELWTQYGLYQESVLLCNKMVTDNENWNKVVYWVFDAPGIGNKPFEVKNSL